MLSLLNLRTATAGAAAAVLLFLTGGCGEAIHNSGEDNSFIRQPGDPAGTKLKMKAGPLLPVRTGSVWRNAVTVQRLSGSSSNRDPNVDDNGIPFVKTYEQSKSKIIGTSAKGGGSDVRIDMQQEGLSAPNRAEIFAVSNRGIFLSRIEGELALTVLPPLPVITYPIRENEVETWNGKIRIKNKTYPSQGYTRIGNPEEIETPQGKVLARKVETILTTAVNGRPTSFPMTRWFAPGIGMVRQKFISGNLEVTKNIIQYKL